VESNNGSAVLPTGDDDDVTVGLLPAQAVRAPLRAGDRVDRYILLEELGAGGMGVVFLAYDPTLDRNVALKLLHGNARGRAVGRQRMIREAQSLAKLSHPNVVVVHEVGTTDDGVFIAMEHIAGDTLRRWAAKEQDWREVVRVLIAAGRGLAAAHSAGLVHRDFKPANVLMGEGARRPRVVDFGLARPPAPSTESREAALMHPVSDTSTLTETGVVLGTPRYMAPEQHKGDAGDAACDQYAYCVAFYEALYRKPPFAGKNTGELLASKLGADLAFPKAVDVPSRLQAVLRRGLSPKASDRFASMDALLAELQRLIARRGRTNMVAIAVIGVLAGSGWLAFGASGDVCGGGRARVDSVWTAEARSSTAAAFEAASPVLGKDTWQRIGPVLDEYADQWAEGHRDACEASEIRREQSAEVLDDRTRCLDERLRHLRALAGTLQGADRATVRGAARAVASLPDIERCADTKFVQTHVAPPKNAEEQGEVERLRDAIAVANAVGNTGHYDDARLLLEDLSAEVEQLGYEPLRVEHALALASSVRRNGDFADSEVQLRKILVDARRLGAPRLQSGAELALIEVLDKLDRADDALWLARLVEADAEREQDIRRQAQVLSRRGSMLSFRGEHDRAVASLEKALRLREQFDPGGLTVASTHNALASALLRAGRPDRAERAFRMALSMARELLGSRHPHVAATLSNLSVLLVDKGETDEALGVIREALDISRAVLGPNHPSTAAYLDNESTVFSTMGRYDEALEALDSALTIRLDRLGPKSERVAKTYNNIAVIQYQRRNFDDALANFRRALDIRTETLGEGHPETLKAVANLGGVLVATGDIEQAEPLLERSTAARVKLLGADHPDAITARANLARLRIEQGRLVEAATIADEITATAKRVLPNPHPSWGGIWQLHGLLATEDGRHADAVAMYTKEVAAFTATRQVTETEGANKRLAEARLAAGGK